MRKRKNLHILQSIIFINIIDHKPLHLLEIHNLTVQLQITGFHICDLVVHTQVIASVVAEGWCWPAFRHPSSCSLSLPPQQVDNRMKRSWILIKTGRSLTSYQYEQNRLDFEENQFKYFQIRVER